MTTKLKIPKIRFKEFSGEWEEKKLGEVSEVITKGTTPSYFSKTGIKFIKIECLNSNIIDNSKCLFISDEIHNKELKRSILQENDLLFAIAGATIGKCTIVKKENLPSNTNQALSIIRLKNNISHDYVLSILKSVLMRKYILLNISVGAQPNLNLEQMGNFKLNLPSLIEQQKIASFLSSVDDKIEKVKEKKKNLEEYKKGVMQKIFSQEIRFKDENGEEFGEWEEKKLGEIGDFQTSSIDKLSRNGEKEVYLVNYMNVYRHESINNLSKNNLQKVTAKDSQILSNNLKKGDILFTPSSETPDDIGHSVVIFEDLENCVYSYHLMRFRPKIQLNILYSHYFCNIPEILNQLAKLSTGSTRFTISVKSFSSIKVNLPDLKEQEKIADFLSGIDEKIEKVIDELEKMEEFKKGLLQGMFI